MSGQRRPGQGGAGAPPAAADGGPRPWAQLVQERTLLAMLLEASVPKPGNVGPGLSRPGTHYHHYLASAAALGPSLRAATEGTVPLGQTVLQAVRDSQASQPGGNVHLGVILLAYPLARAAVQRGPWPPTAPPSEQVRCLRSAVQELLATCGPDDSVHYFDAVSAASPGGVHPLPGSDYDVHDASTRQRLQRNGLPLLAWMAMGKDRNAVAAEYCQGYPLSTGVGLQALQAHWDIDREGAIRRAYLALLATAPDPMVSARGGDDAALEVQRAASTLLATAGEGVVSVKACGPLDRWLRKRQLNPGATADLTAATIQLGLLTHLTWTAAATG